MKKRISLEIIRIIAICMVNCWLSFMHYMFENMLRRDIFMHFTCLNCSNFEDKEN